MDRKTIKKIGKENFRKQWGELLLALVLVSVGGTFASVMTIGAGGFVVTGPLSFGMTYLYYRYTQGERPNQLMLLQGFKTRFGDSFLVGILLMVIRIVPVIIGLISSLTSLVSMIRAFSYSYYYGYSGHGGGGSVLLSLLSIAATVVCLYLFYGFCFAMYILVREDITAVDALKKSWAMTKGQKGKLFMFDLSYLGWWILVGMTFGILAIWVSPYYNLSKIVMYNDIYDNSPVKGVPDNALKDQFQGFKKSVEQKVENVEQKGFKKAAEDKAADVSQKMKDAYAIHKDDTVHPYIAMAGADAEGFTQAPPTTPAPAVPEEPVIAAALDPNVTKYVPNEPVAEAAPEAPAEPEKAPEVVLEVAEEAPVEEAPAAEDIELVMPDDIAVSVEDAAADVTEDVIAEEEPEERFCKVCGAKLVPGADFCVKCGAKQD